ncbi:MAG: divalent-cation tolerance protein CutA [Desulfobacteraceae bacterium]|nr:MAG: divalent-cation tolerance protein CutA [Desulfobacteraceae bacterium]
MTEYIQVVTTAGSKEEAQKLAGELVGRRLAACAQVMGPITSTYWWQGVIETADEWLCVLKGRRDLFEELAAVLKEIHSYQVPEILALPAAAVGQEYQAWLAAELKR